MINDLLIIASTLLVVLSVILCIPRMRGFKIASITFGVAYIVLLLLIDVPALSNLITGS